MSNLTAKQINTKIKTFLSSDKKQRDKIQELLELTIGHAKEHGDLTCLSALIHGLQQNKSRNIKVISRYVLDHVSGIQWTTSDKYTGYKKIKDRDIEVKAFEIKWFEHKSNTQIIAVDPMARIKGLVTSLNKALEAGNVKDGEEQTARDALAALKPFLEA
jgi:hypothetical protein